jgi:hypothetical protein
VTWSSKFDKGRHAIRRTPDGGLVRTLDYAAPMGEFLGRGEGYRLFGDIQWTDDASPSLKMRMGAFRDAKVSIRDDGAVLAVYDDDPSELWDRRPEPHLLAKLGAAVRAAFFLTEPYAVVHYKDGRLDVFDVAWLRAAHEASTRYDASTKEDDDALVRAACDGPLRRSRFWTDDDERALHLALQGAVPRACAH